jgi:hypothetical protein
MKYNIAQMLDIFYEMKNQEFIIPYVLKLGVKYKSLPFYFLVNLSNQECILYILLDWFVKVLTAMTGYCSPLFTVPIGGDF